MEKYNTQDGETILGTAKYERKNIYNTKKVWNMEKEEAVQVVEEKEQTSRRFTRTKIQKNKTKEKKIQKTNFLRRIY